MSALRIVRFTSVSDRQVVKPGDGGFGGERRVIFHKGDDDHGRRVIFRRRHRGC